MTTYEADERGYFGGAESGWGGRFMPEALVAALDELDAAWRDARDDPDFQRDFEAILRDFANAPSPLYHAERLSEQLGVTDLPGRGTWLR